MTKISISTLHNRLKVYLATPRGKGPLPGVIALHDIFGLPATADIPQNRSEPYHDDSQ